MARKSSKSTKKSAPIAPSVSGRAVRSSTSKSSSKISKNQNSASSKIQNQVHNSNTSTFSAVSLNDVSQVNLQTLIKSRCQNQQIFYLMFSNNKHPLCQNLKQDMLSQPGCSNSNLKIIDSLEADLILEAIYYLFNSKTIKLIEKLVPRKSCVLAICQNLKSNYELLGFLENIDEVNYSKSYLVKGGFY